MSTPHVPNPHLLESESWASKHRDLLKRCFERRRDDGEWPNLEDLQHDFALGGNDDLDVRTIAYSIPSSLGRVDNQCLVLRARALRHIAAADRLLDAWCVSLQTACRLWLREGREARLRRSDVADVTGGDRQLTNFVSELLLRERWAFGDGQGGPEDDWSQEIISDVRIARDVRGAEELLAKRDEIEFPLELADTRPKGDDASPVGAEPPPGEPSSIPGFAKNPLLVTVLGGLLVLLIWAAATSGFEGAFGDDEQGGSPPSGVNRGTAGTSVPEADTKDETGRGSDASPETTLPEASPKPVYVGLESLREDGATYFDVGASYENRTIGGKTYSDAVTGTVYPDGSGMGPQRIFTKGRFSAVQFTVGIDAEAACPLAVAKVWVEDQSGSTLWGPREVNIDEPITKTVPIEDAIQIRLAQHSMGTDADCNLGEAQVSWGGVKLREA